MDEHFFCSTYFANPELVGDGAGGGKMTMEKALDEIHKTSAGIPRMINRICEKALMYAFQNQKRLIDDYMIKYVVEHERLGTMTT